MCLAQNFAIPVCTMEASQGWLRICLKWDSRQSQSNLYAVPIKRQVAKVKNDSAKNKVEIKLTECFAQLHLGRSIKRKYEAGC